MQVKNIECQIAQAQLRRYLTGEEMTNAIVTDLETHLRHCAECMDAAQTLRESLQGVLNGKITGKSVAPRPEQRTQPRPEQKTHAPVAHTATPTHAAVMTPADFLDAPDEQFRPAKTPKKSNVKTLLYSGALAIVLFLMSTVFQDPTKLFGPRASSVTKDTPPVAETPAKDTPVAVPAAAGPDAPVAGSSDAGAAGTVKTDIPASSTEVSEPAKLDSGKTALPKTNEPLKTSGLIVADGISGTSAIKADPPKKNPKPQPKAQLKKKPSGGSTIKVYPPLH